MQKYIYISPSKKDNKTPSTSQMFFKCPPDPSSFHNAYILANSVLLPNP